MIAARLPSRTTRASDPPNEAFAEPENSALRGNRPIQPKHQPGSRPLETQLTRTSCRTCVPTSAPLRWSDAMIWFRPADCGSRTPGRWRGRNKPIRCSAGTQDKRRRRRGADHRRARVLRFGTNMLPCGSLGRQSRVGSLANRSFNCLWQESQRCFSKLRHGSHSLNPAANAATRS